MKSRYVLTRAALASTMVLNAVTATYASDSANRMISYEPVPGHASGELKGDIPLSQIGDTKLTQGLVNFDGNNVVITANSTGSSPPMTLTGQVISPELSVHDKNVKYSSGVYFSRPQIASLPNTPEPKTVEKLKLKDGTTVEGSIRKISNQAVTIVTSQGQTMVPLDTVTKIESPKMFRLKVVGSSTTVVEPGTPFQLTAKKIELEPAATEDRNKRREAAVIIAGLLTATAIAVPVSLSGGGSSAVPFGAPVVPTSAVVPPTPTLTTGTTSTGGTHVIKPSVGPNAVTTHNHPGVPPNAVTNHHINWWPKTLAHTPQTVGPKAVTNVNHGIVHLGQIASAHPGVTQGAALNAANTKAESYPSSSFSGGFHHHHTLL